VRRFIVKRLVVLLATGAFLQAYGPYLSAHPRGVQDQSLPPSEATAKAALEK
jgi:hypothetical protein